MLDPQVALVAAAFLGRNEERLQSEEEDKSSRESGAGEGVRVVRRGRRERTVVRDHGFL